MAKGTLNTWPAAGSTCAAPTIAGGFLLLSTDLRGQSGELDAELLSNPWPGTWRQNLFGPGGLMATYNYLATGAGYGPPPPPPVPVLSFNFNDRLGTRRMQVNAAGQLEQYWQSDPFGDYMTPYGSGIDAAEQHLTGKEHDTESGNDYFGARYYASSTGRFISPDPYAGSMNPAFPQAFNRYVYAANNPLRFTDPTGLDCVYMNDAGDAAESVDHHSNSKEWGGWPSLRFSGLHLSSKNMRAPR